MVGDVTLLLEPGEVRDLYVEILSRVAGEG
jgi:hypothetical protein